MFKPRQVLQPSTTDIDIDIEANIYTEIETITSTLRF